MDITKAQTVKIDQLVDKGWLPIFTVPDPVHILHVTLEHHSKDDVKVLINRWGAMFYHEDTPLPLPSL